MKHVQVPWEEVLSTLRTGSGSGSQVAAGQCGHLPASCGIRGQNQKEG